VVELPFAADCPPCVEKLRTVLPLTVGVRDGGSRGRGRVALSRLGWSELSGRYMHLQAVVAERRVEAGYRRGADRSDAHGRVTSARAAARCRPHEMPTTLLKSLLNVKDAVETPVEL
jgi:hypothetical protein